VNWNDLDRDKYRDEAEAITVLQGRLSLTPQDRAIIQNEAVGLVRSARKLARRQGVLESFLQEFSLGTREGLALMCLAEALLRTPDQDTRDQLIAEKIGSADWASHLGQSDNLFVNASTWGLMLTGRLVDVDEAVRSDLIGYLKSLTARIGEPVIRAAITQAIKIMGEQFVLGRTISAATKRAKAEGQICSFDMLGEGARTVADAVRYEAAYAEAIFQVSKMQNLAGPESGHGISVKLSALSPRFEAVQEHSVERELYPRIRRLAVMAAKADINLTLDAEEVDRLVPSLQILERLALEPELGEWRGLGLAVQAYQKRALAVIDALTELAKTTGRRLMVRLVKGAYWDSEIKRAQVAGRPGYPVYTTKAATDLSYLVCAEALIQASPYLYTQFATHNAHSLAAVRRLAEGAGVVVEHQRLHGMGEALYHAAHDYYGTLKVRTYAPVGQHEDLLPYLVRRLLENGANTSFVNALLDDRVPAETLVTDPIDTVAALPGPHPKIPLPTHIYGAERLNSSGIDLSMAAERHRLAAAVATVDKVGRRADPMLQAKAKPGANPHSVRAPADRRKVLGQASDATEAQIESAFALAKLAQPLWDEVGGLARAKVLRRVADGLEARIAPLTALLSREAGKTLSDGLAEVREAADFCRYYARLAETQFETADLLTGPVGETNSLSLRGRGVFVCISPWNFPLAIFVGQIAAALAAGNAVLAKPAEQTPLIAADTVGLFHASGLDPRLLALIPGPGETVGASLCAHQACDGVAFTGGVQTAQAINRILSDREGPIIPLIAETGGLNGLFVDTTAQREQVIDDVIASAFGSAGQRCSAARLVFLPQETAEGLIEGLKGAMDVLVIGDPASPETDIGPVIDEAARQGLNGHLAELRQGAKILHQIEPDLSLSHGSFFGPVLVQIAKVEDLKREVFGPILHVVVYGPGEVETVARGLASLRYGLTLGIHSRIEAFVDKIRRLVPAGNVYVNRAMTGAVVGVQPFGGEGLSGTGPKAGGPHALMRYAVERTVSINTTAQGGDPALLNL